MRLLGGVAQVLSSLWRLYPKQVTLYAQSIQIASDWMHDNIMHVGCCKFVLEFKRKRVRHSSRHVTQAKARHGGVRPIPMLFSKQES